MTAAKRVDPASLVAKILMMGHPRRRCDSRYFGQYRFVASPCG